MSSYVRIFEEEYDCFFTILTQSQSRTKNGYKPVWQKRYYEHTIRDEREIKFDYIHFNPVKHGFVSKTSFSSNRVTKALRLAANALYNSKSYLGNYFRKMRSRLGAPKAITAVAHKLARIVYAMLKKQTLYDESIFSAEEAKYQEKLLKKPQKQANSFGLALVDAPLAEST